MLSILEREQGSYCGSEPVNGIILGKDNSLLRRTQLPKVKIFPAAQVGRYPEGYFKILWVLR